MFVYVLDDEYNKRRHDDDGCVSVEGFYTAAAFFVHFVVFVCLLIRDWSGVCLEHWEMSTRAPIIDVMSFEFERGDVLSCHSLGESETM